MRCDACLFLFRFSLSRLAERRLSCFSSSFGSVPTCPVREFFLPSFFFFRTSLLRASSSPRFARFVFSGPRRTQRRSKATYLARRLATVVRNVAHLLDPVSSPRCSALSIRLRCVLLTIPLTSQDYLLNEARGILTQRIHRLLAHLHDLRVDQGDPYLEEDDLRYLQTIWTPPVEPCVQPFSRWQGLLAFFVSWFEGNLSFGRISLFFLSRLTRSLLLSIFRLDLDVLRDLYASVFSIFSLPLWNAERCRVASSSHLRLLQFYPSSLASSPAFYELSAPPPDPSFPLLVPSSLGPSSVAPTRRPRSRRMLLPRLFNGTPILQQAKSSTFYPTQEEETASCTRCSQERTPSVSDANSPRRFKQSSASTSSKESTPATPFPSATPKPPSEIFTFSIFNNTASSTRKVRREQSSSTKSMHERSSFFVAFLGSGSSSLPRRSRIRWIPISLDRKSLFCTDRSITCAWSRLERLR